MAEKRWPAIPNPDSPFTNLQSLPPRKVSIKMPALHFPSCDKPRRRDRSIRIASLLASSEQLFRCRIAENRFCVCYKFPERRLQKRKACYRSAFTRRIFSAIHLYQGLVAWMPGRDARQGEEECAPSVLASTDFTRPVWEQQNDASLELLRSLGCSLSFFVPALIER